MEDEAIVAAIAAAAKVQAAGHTGSGQLCILVFDDDEQEQKQREPEAPLS